MSEPFLSQIEIFGFNFAPRGWAICSGQTLSIQQNTAVFALLGTTYGGNGTTNFQLPDLRSRIPVGFGQGRGLSNYVLGEVGGTETVTLLQNQIATHSHLINADSSATTTTTNVPSSSVTLGRSSGTASGSSFAVNIYNTGSAPTTLSSETVGFTGQNQAHSNLMPTLCMNYCICLFGIFPSRN
jgi:microcystin-dependent protein